MTSRRPFAFHVVAHSLPYSAVLCRAPPFSAVFHSTTNAQGSRQCQLPLCYAVDPIHTTTQFLLDVFRLDQRLYIRPVKVQYRSRDVVNTVHVRQGEVFLPVRDSAVLASILSRTQ